MEGGAGGEASRTVIAPAESDTRVIKGTENLRPRWLEGEIVVERTSVSRVPTSRRRLVFAHTSTRSAQLILRARCTEDTTRASQFAGQGGFLPTPPVVPPPGCLCRWRGAYAKDARAVALARRPRGNDDRLARVCARPIPRPRARATRACDARVFVNEACDGTRDGTESARRFQTFWALTHASPVSLVFRNSAARVARIPRAPHRGNWDFRQRLRRGACANPRADRRRPLSPPASLRSRVRCIQTFEPRPLGRSAFLSFH